MCIRDRERGWWVEKIDNETELQAYITQFDNDFLLQEYCTCLLYTSDAADERSSVDLGGRRIIKKKKKYTYSRREDQK